ncbi:hypothetical protein [Actinomadura rudentiformis]|uniref:Uncharacterized protein n=1 Tax=Actinomadura rudentiformis TaxID=359158 RepID=A0A6H9Z3W9_9ACTN|nr:hypothetical protein [Actinomadura rudentiformis]KAB2349501.1 hypothetical protein F8566_12020 [Actinomadura rudentiformis]
MSDDEKSRLGEFSARLESDDIDVVREALDDYQSAQADTRWGVDNPYWPVANEVLFAARDLLGQPPSGRSHASALTAMLHLAEEEDADLIADVLEGVPDAEVREMALLAAGTALAKGEEPNRRLLALITAMALDEDLDVRERKDALHPLEGLDLPEAEDLLVRLSESSELELQVHAAGCLATPLRLRVHRDRVKQLAESWPEDAGWEAKHIREALEGFHSTYWKDTELDDPVLRKAHDELRFPLTDEGCLKAFATLLRSEDPVAVGIALDHYESSEGLRYVLEDEERAEAYMPEVLARAREVLRRPMSLAEVSALNMIGTQHAEPADADLLLDVLTRTDSDAVRKEAIWTAYGVLDQAKDGRLVTALGDLILDPTVGFYITKETAIRVLADTLGADADDLLLRALREGEPKVQAHASYYLVRTGGLDRHRAILEEVAESWGDRPPQHPWGEDPIELIFGKPHSVHWEGHRLADPELHRAHKRLRAPTVDESYHQALRTLLESDDQAALGIALDHWWSPDGAAKRGGEEAREPDRAMVLDRIRDMLRQPPSPAELSSHYGPDALHLSALAALRVAAEPSLVAEVVETAASDLIRSQALDTVQAVFEEAEEADLRLVEALGNVACDKNVPLHDRVRALELLDESPGTNSVDALVRATRCPELEVQAAAAWGLMWDEVIEDHRALLEELNANWPVEDPPWEVTRVRDMLNAVKE